MASERTMRTSLMLYWTKSSFTCCELKENSRGVIYQQNSVSYMYVDTITEL